MVAQTRQSRSTRPSTSRTVATSALQTAIKGAPVVGPGSPGTIGFVEDMIAKASGYVLSNSGAAKVEPLPPDTENIPGSALIGVTLCIYDVEMITDTHNVGGEDKQVRKAQFTFYMPQRPELGKRKVKLSSAMAKAQAIALMADGLSPEQPRLVTIEQDAPAFPGATPANILCDPRPENEEATYYHAPNGEKPVAY